MAATVQLTLDQLAQAISQLTPEELETLDILLDPETAVRMLTRSQQYEELRETGRWLTLEDLREELKED
jgi:hypothetical protein